MKKVYGILKIKVILDLSCSVDVLKEVIDDMDYNLLPDVDHATLVDSEIIDFEVTDVK
jgi:hypothetical protein